MNDNAANSWRKFRALNNGLHMARHIVNPRLSFEEVAQQEKKVADAWKELTDEERACVTYEKRRRRHEADACQPLGPGAPHTEQQLFLTALSQSWVKWSADDRISDDDLVAVFQHYFQGIDVEITRRDGGLRGGGRVGFDIFLNALPLVKHMDVGTDPNTVTPVRQLILVQATDTSFHTCSDVFRGPTCALAFGLCDYVRQLVEDRRETPRAMWHRWKP